MAIVAHGKKSDSQLGATIVAALLMDNEKLVVGNVGDSRAYLFRLGALKQISRDHSIVHELDEHGPELPSRSRIISS